MLQYAQRNRMKKRSSAKKQIIIWLSVFLVVIGLVAAELVFSQTQFFTDQVTAWKYPLNNQVKILADEAGVNNKGKFLLQVSRAEIDGSAAFPAAPAISENQGALDGYYQAKDKRIYIYNITDPRVSGLKAVTAAHEMLHAAYDRLSETERSKIDKEIQAYIPNIKSQDIKDQLKLYAQLEPGKELNELHSLLGTEEAKLPPDLENYYKQYFTNRQKVVELFEKTSAVFNNLKQQIEKLQATMDRQKTAITTDENTYAENESQLNSDIQSFNTELESGLMSQNEYYSRRADLLARQNAQNALYQKVQSEIDTYNAEAAQLNELGGQAAQLNSAINGS